MIGRLGWKPGELEKRLTAAPDKVRIARRLRGEPIMTLKWIEERLRICVWPYVATNLYKTTNARGQAMNQTEYQC